MLRIRYKKFLLLIMICLMLILSACQSRLPPQPSQIPDIKTKSITGIVVDQSEDTITVADQQSEYLFSIDQAEVQDFSVGDTLRVHYREDAPAMAVEIELLQPAPQQPSDEIYEVLGTAASISGEKWEKMQDHRKQLTEIAKEHRDFIHLNMDPAQKIVYLTFDDGPDPVNTLRVMQTLLEQEVGGSFFLTGENIKKNPELVKELSDNGFTIGLHGYNHISFDGLSAAQIAQQLDSTNALLEEITGKPSYLMRPPYGALSPATIEAIRAQNYDIYLWSLDTLDWAQSDSKDILRNVKEHLRPGEIILMHATYDEALTAEVLPQVISYIKEQGYTMAALPQKP